MQKYLTFFPDINSIFIIPLRAETNHRVLAEGTLKGTIIGDLFLI
jgi:hypothetical protein